MAASRAISCETKETSSLRLRGIGRKDVSTKNPVRQSGNKLEYLPQRRKGRKVRRLRVKIIPTSFYLSPLNLATLRLGGKNFRLRVLSASRSLAQAMQIVTCSNTKATKTSTGDRRSTLRFFVNFVFSVVKCFSMTAFDTPGMMFWSSAAAMRRCARRSRRGAPARACSCSNARRKIFAAAIAATRAIFATCTGRRPSSSPALTAKKNFGRIFSESPAARPTSVWPV